MRSPARLDRDHRWRQLGKKLWHRLAAKPLAQHHCFRRIHSMQLKNILRRIHPNADNLAHGRPPVNGSLTTSFWHNRCRRGPSTPSTPCRLRVVPSASCLTASEDTEYAKAISARRHTGGTAYGSRLGTN